MESTRIRKHAVLYPVNTHKLLLFCVFFVFLFSIADCGFAEQEYQERHSELLWWPGLQKHHGLCTEEGELLSLNVFRYLTRLNGPNEFFKYVVLQCSTKQNTCLTRQDSSPGLKWSWIIIASCVGCTVAQRNKEAACSKIHLLTEEERQVVRHFAFSVMPHRVRRCLAWPVPMEQDCVSTEWYFGCLRAQQLVNVVWKVIWLFSKHLPRFASLHNGTVQLFNDWLPSRKIVFDYFHHPPETHLFLQCLSACLFCTRVQ